MPEILRIHLAELMQAALDSNSKDMSKNLQITKPKNRPTGEFSKRDYNIARWAYVEGINTDRTLEEIKSEICNHFNLESRTVEQAIQNYSVYAKMADEFHDLTKK